MQEGWGQSTPVWGHAASDFEPTALVKSKQKINSLVNSSKNTLISSYREWLSLIIEFILDPPLGR